MNSIVRRAAFRPMLRAARPVQAIRREATASASGTGSQSDRELGKAALKAGPKQDPELYVSNVLGLRSEELEC